MNAIDILFFYFLTYSPLLGVLGVVFLILFFVCKKWKHSIRTIFLVVGCAGIGQGVLVIAFFVISGLLGLGPVPS